MDEPNPYKSPSVTPDRGALGRRRAGWSARTAVAVALVVPSLLAIAAFAFSWWVSTLPVISGVSLALVFRSWMRILEFTFMVWLYSLGLVAPICFLRWWRGRRYDKVS
jgi:hypothetical protein